jgi:hypothetical protein
MRTEEIEINGHKFRFRTWNYGMKQEAMQKAVKFVPSRMDPNTLEPVIDLWILNDQLLIKTLVEWDLKDEKGQSLPITLENIQAIEPPELVEKMIAFVQRLNNVSTEARKKS